MKIIRIISLLMMIVVISSGQVVAEPLVDVDETANDRVSNLGTGWNLGNTLDAFDCYDQYAYEDMLAMDSDFQIMMEYITEPYTGWDASDAVYFTGQQLKAELVWEMNQLNSESTSLPGRVGISLINHMNQSDSTIATCVVTQANILLADGTSIELKDLIGSHRLTFNGIVSSKVYIDMSQFEQLVSTDMLEGAVVSLRAQISSINDVPYQASISKIDYYETLWKNIITTEEMILAVKEAGFDSVRIPVTYFNHLDGEGNIDEAWLDRVEEVVNYVLDNDLYCIINVHHDTGVVAWIKADINKLTMTEGKFTYLWAQIADRFKEYDDDLMFEGYNELLNNKNEWGYAGVSDYEVANILNQSFVDTVRASGGKNTDRYLILNSYAASADNTTLNAFVVPEDSAEDKLIGSVHYYEVTEDMIFSALTRISATSARLGIPFILGECSVYLPDTGNAVSMAEFLVNTAYSKNIACFWWDSGGVPQNSNVRDFVLLNREDLSWYYPEVVQAFVSPQDPEEVLDSEQDSIFGDSSSIIPYTSVDYIQVTSGGGGFNTRYLVDSDSSVSLDMAFTNVAGYGDYLRAYSSNSNRLVFRQESSKGLYVAYGWYSSAVSKPIDGQRIELTQSGTTTKIDGNTVRISAAQNFSTGRTLQFGMRPMKIYGLKIWEGDIAIRDYVPVVDDDGIACLYDRVEGTLVYAAQGVDAGNEVEVSDSVSEEPVGEALTQEETADAVITSQEDDEADGPDTSEALIEDDYEAVITGMKFGSGSGFSTGINADSKTSVYLKMGLTDVEGYGNYLMAYNNNSNRLQIRQESTKGIHIAYGWYNSSVVKPEVGEVVEILQGKGVTQINGKTVRTSAYQSFDTGANIAIGAKGMILYALKIWDDGLLVRDYIPVLDDEGTACLFDQVSGTLNYFPKPTEAVVE